MLERAKKLTLCGFHVLVCSVQPRAVRARRTGGPSRTTSEGSTEVRGPVDKWLPLIRDSHASTGVTYRLRLQHNILNMTTRFQKYSFLNRRSGYMVHEFGGRKFIRLAETSWMGGRSRFLGIAYCLVGACCLAAAVFFAVISRKTRT